MQEINRIVAIGPESTGKSTLCSALAKRFNTVWCPEFAREYLLKHGVAYNYDDLLTIAKGQVALEEEYIEKAIKHWNKNGQKTAKPLLFVDTDMYVMKVWCEYVFGTCHAFINEQIARSKPALYLLCNVDLPWVKDELREYPDLKARQELYDIYKNILLHQPVQWIDVSGDNEERVQKAVSFIEANFT